MKNWLNSIKNAIKLKKSEEFSEKSYLKSLILQEKQNKKSLEPTNLAARFGTTKELVEEIIKELNEDKPKEVKKITKPKKQIIKQSKEKINKLLDESDKNTLKDIFFKVTLFGIPMNLGMFIVSHGYYFFNYYSWICWGCFLYILEKKISPIIRGVIHK